MIAAEAAAQAITSLELVVREKELMLELAEIKHDEEKEKMVRPFDPHPLQMDEKLTTPWMVCPDAGFCECDGADAGGQRGDDAAVLLARGRGVALRFLPMCGSGGSRDAA